MKKENAFEGGILITGNYGKETVEIPINDVQKLVNVEEDKFGCSGGKNIGKTIVPLFAFSNLQKLDRMRIISNDDKMKAIELSISSGVLCKYTGYVGMTERPANFYHDLFALQTIGCCCHSCCRSYCSSTSNDSCCSLTSNLASRNSSSKAKHRHKKYDDAPKSIDCCCKKSEPIEDKAIPTKYGDAPESIACCCKESEPIEVKDLPT